MQKKGIPLPFEHDPPTTIYRLLEFSAAYFLQWISDGTLKKF
ncbi:hypothetical protein BH18THE2_BH18THE2_39230 [soil metagenome]